MNFIVESLPSITLCFLEKTQQRPFEDIQYESSSYGAEFDNCGAVCYGKTTRVIFFCTSAIKFPH